MEIQYVIINFIILITILVIAGRKTVKRIFGDRLVNINNELDEAEKKSATLKNMAEKEQIEVSLENLDELIKIVKE